MCEIYPEKLCESEVWEVIITQNLILLKMHINTGKKNLMNESDHPDEIMNEWEKNSCVNATHNNYRDYTRD